jgi:hypothetical protein
VQADHDGGGVVAVAEEPTAFEEELGVGKRA